MQGEIGFDKQAEIMQQQLIENKLQMLQILDEVTERTESDQPVSYAIDKLEEFFSHSKMNIAISDYSDEICAKIQGIVLKIANEYAPVQLERLLVFLQRHLQYTKQQQYQSYLISIFNYLMDLQAKISWNIDLELLPPDLLAWDWARSNVSTNSSNDDQTIQDIKYLSTILRGSMQILRLAVSSGFVEISCNVSIASLETCEHFYRKNEALEFLKLFKDVQLRKSSQTIEDRQFEIKICTTRTNVTSVLLNLKLFTQAHELLVLNGKQLKAFKINKQSEEDDNLQEKEQKSIIRHLFESCKYFSLQKQRLQLLVGLVQVLNISPLSECEGEGVESLMWSSLLWQEPLTERNRLTQLFNSRFTLQNDENTILMTDDLPNWWDVTCQLKKESGILGKARAYTYSFFSSQVPEKLLQFLKKLQPEGLEWGSDECEYIKTMLNEYKELIQLKRSLGNGVSDVVFCLMRNAALLGLINESKVDINQIKSKQELPGVEVTIRPVLKRILETVKTTLGDVPGTPDHKDIKNALLNGLRSGILQIQLSLSGTLEFNGAEAKIKLFREKLDVQEEKNQQNKCQILQQFTEKLVTSPENIQNELQAIINKIEAKMTFDQDEINDFYLLDGDQDKIIEERKNEIEDEVKQKQAEQAVAEATRQNEEENRAKSSLLAEQRRKAVELSISNNSKICQSFIQKFALEIGEKELVESLQGLLLKFQREFRKFLEDQSNIQKKITEAETIGDTKLVQELTDELTQQQRPVVPDLWFRRLNERANEFFAAKHECLAQNAQKTANEAEFKLYCLYNAKAKEDGVKIINEYNKCIHDIKAYPEARQQYQQQYYQAQMAQIQPYLDLDASVLLQQQMQIDKKHIQRQLTSYYGSVQQLTFEMLKEQAEKKVQELRVAKEKKENELKQIRLVQATILQKQKMRNQQLQQQNIFKPEDVPSEQDVKRYKAGGFIPSALEEKIKKAIQKGICLEDGTIKSEVLASLKQREKSSVKPSQPAPAPQSNKKPTISAKPETTQKSEAELKRQRVLGDLEKEAQSKKEVEMPTPRELEAYRKGSFLPESIKNKIKIAIEKGLIADISLLPVGDGKKK